MQMLRMERKPSNSFRIILDRHHLNIYDVNNYLATSGSDPILDIVKAADEVWHRASTSSASCLKTIIQPKNTKILVHFDWEAVLLFKNFDHALISWLCDGRFQRNCIAKSALFPVKIKDDSLYSAVLHMTKCIKGARSSTVLIISHNLHYS